MNISIKTTYVDLTGPLREYVEEKIGHLEKYAETMEARVELERDQHHKAGLVFRAEVNLKVAGKTLRAEAEAEDIYAAIDLMIPKIKEQLTKFKDKKTTLRRQGARKAKEIR